MLLEILQTYNATERITVEEKNLFQRHQMTKPSAHSESVISSSSLRYVLELYGFLLLCNLYILKQQKDFPSINLKSVFCAWSFKNTSWENRQKVREGVECHNEYYFAKFSLMQICNKRWKLKIKQTQTYNNGTAAVLVNGPIYKGDWSATINHMPGNKLP